MRVYNHFKSGNIGLKWGWRLEGGCLLPAMTQAEAAELML